MHQQKQNCFSQKFIFLITWKLIKETFNNDAENGRWDEGTQGNHSYIVNAFWHVYLYQN